MANFNTHLAVAAIGSGLCATVADAANVVPTAYLLTLTMAGTVGGILPDIDLEKAVPSRMLFGALGVVLAFISLFAFRNTYSIAELWIIWLAVFLFVRYVIFKIFHQRTHHRGIWHSFAAGGFFMTLAAIIFERVFGETPTIAWLTGFFVMIGFLIHLILDEIYSVDIEGVAIKKSFGTAFKPLDFHSWRASLLMVAALAAALWFAPATKGFEDLLRPPSFFAFLKERLLPKGPWFSAKPVTTALTEKSRDLQQASPQ